MAAVCHACSAFRYASHERGAAGSSVSIEVELDMEHVLSLREKRDALLQKLERMFAQADRYNTFSALVLLGMKDIPLQEAARTEIRKIVQRVAQEHGHGRTVHHAAARHLAQKLGAAKKIWRFCVQRAHDPSQRRQ